MIGLGNNYLVCCDKCNKGLDIVTASSKCNHKFLEDIYECSCGNKFTYFEGIINDICSDHSHSEFSFISNIERRGQTKITVGKTAIVEIDVNCLINEVSLTPSSASVWLKWQQTGKNSFKIISSEVEDRDGFDKSKYPKLGEENVVNWYVYGRTSKEPVEIWNELLVKAKEQIINQDYLLCFFSSAAAIEAFYNIQLSIALKNKGLNDVAIQIFLKESSFPEKLFKLSESILNFKQDKSKNKSIEKIIMTRNLIAHGKTVNITRELSKECFKTVVSIIYHYLIYYSKITVVR